MRNKHEGKSNDSKQVSGKKSSNKNAKAKNDHVSIPCDVCKFIAKTTTEFMKHVEDHNKERMETSLPCELCDYKARTSNNFKEHIETAHGIKVRNSTSSSHKNVKSKLGLCVFWNRGSCNFDDETCRFEHKNIEACRFQERCYKPECKFFHEPSLGKFPFLGLHRNAVQSPNHHRRHHQQDQQRQSQGAWHCQGRF